MAIEERMEKDENIAIGKGTEWDEGGHGPLGTASSAKTPLVRKSTGSAHAPLTTDLSVNARQASESVDARSTGKSADARHPGENDGSDEGGHGLHGAPAGLPLWLNLSGKRCVVVGGGQVAERRIGALLAAQADITVVSPAVTDRIAGWIAQGKITGVPRDYESGDGAGAVLLIAATNLRQVNEAVYRDAVQAGQWINQVDCAHHSNCSFPAVVQRGKLGIAISTSGASPALALRIRKELEGRYGDEYEEYLDFLAEFRLIVSQRISNPLRRRAALQKVLQSEALERIRQGNFARHKQRLIEQLLEEVE